MEEKQPVRVRIAPSPTGYLHLGTVRTAIFNFLYAKKNGGSFVLRIEDTDSSRSLPMYESNIIDGLKKLGIKWDEGPDIGGKNGPYRQSERKSIYKKYLEKLIDEKKAFWCFCTKEELEEDKKAMLSAGITPHYGGRCKNLTEEERKKKIEEGRSGVIRLVTPRDINIKIYDIVRGSIVVNTDTIGDFIIAKGIDSPLYNFAVAVDDYEMKISHVIRGEDHISNTPKQILIQKSLGFYTPKYAHLPLVLSPDRSKLSKRDLETSFGDYIKDGYLPNAILNFLVLIGWNPGDDSEIMSLEEMIKKFSLKKIQKGGGVFNVEKLDWFNSEYIKKLTKEDLKKEIVKFIPQEWTDSEKLNRVIQIERDRMKKLTDFSQNTKFFFKKPNYDVNLLVWKTSSLEDMKKNLNVVLLELNKLKEDKYTIDDLEKTIMPIAEKLGRGNVLWPLRVSLSGERFSPGPFQIMYALGKKESIDRIMYAIGL